MTKRKFDGCIFDMDGVIFDTEKLWQEGTLAANKKFGVELDEKYRQSCCGKTEERIRKELKDLCPDLDADAYRDFITNYVVETIQNTGAALKAGFLPLIEFLKDRDVKLALATSSGPERVELLFTRHRLDVESIFDAVITAADVKHGKPDPEGFQKAAAALGLPNGACCVLEDAPNGIEAAFRAGSAPIMVIDLIPPDESISKMCYAVKNSLFEVTEIFLS